MRTLVCAIFLWMVLKLQRGSYEAPSPLTPRSQEATEKPGLHTVEHQESQVKEPSTNFPNHDKLINFPTLCSEHYDY